MNISAMNINTSQQTITGL